MDKITLHRIIFLTIISLFSSSSEVISQNNESAELRSIPLLKHFESLDYHGGIQSWSFDQDSSGILYVANNDGLLEFDGNKWIRYDVHNCTKVRAVMIDNQNRIFVGGQGQIGYFIMTENGLVFNSLLKFLPADYLDVAETWKILEHEKKIYFLTESRLFAYKENNLLDLNKPGYIQMIYKVEDKLLAQIYGMGLYEIHNDEFHSLKGTVNIPLIISILAGNGGYYCFSKSGDLFFYDKERLKQLTLPVNTGEISVVLNLKSGEYAIGTQNNGLYLLNPDLTFKQHLTKNEGLTDRTIKSLYEDGFHNLWVALNNGIDYLELSLPFSMINEEVGLEGTGYAACMHDNRIYLGTNNGLFTRKSGASISYNHRYELLPGSDGQVYNISRIENELILNHNNGAFLIKGDFISQFYDIGSWKFVQTSVPGLILGGNYQGISLFRKKNGKWTKVGSISGLNESSRIMEFENDSTLWMTHGSKGAYRLEFDNEMNLIGKVEHFGENNGFPSDNKISVYSLNDKLVFTAEKGIYDFNQETDSFVLNPFFTKWLGTEHVSSIKSNETNTIFFIQDQKLGMLKQESFGTYIKETELFRHINKFINDDLPNVSLIDDHTVLIGAKEGFIRYDPLKDFSINENFQVLLRSIEVRFSTDSSTSYNPAFKENLEISVNQSIKFQYSAPYFDGFEDLIYSYRLLPMDKNWSEWSSVGAKDYPYLPNGSYTFEIKALNVYGMASSITSYKFKVLKPWYFSDIAVIVYVIFGMLIIIVILLFQRKKYLAEKSVLNKSSEQALKEKDEEINQISLESKKEIDRLLNEKLRTEIDLKNDQLTSITMSLMNNNEIVQDGLRKIEKTLEEGGSKEKINRIIKAIDKNLSNNDSWDQFAYQFDQVHGGYLKKLSEMNVKLSPREIKLATLLRMNMSSKEISKMMNITVRSVELGRYRLRKKLRLERDQNLVEYLVELDSKG